jgi:hypothetical protein
LKVAKSRSKSASTRVSENCEQCNYLLTKRGNLFHNLATQENKVINMASHTQLDAAERWIASKASAGVSRAKSPGPSRQSGQGARMSPSPGEPNYSHAHDSVGALSLYKNEIIDASACFDYQRWFGI